MVQAGKNQEKAQSEKKIPTRKTEVGKKTKLTIRYLNLTKKMKTYKRRQQHTKF